MLTTYLNHALPIEQRVVFNRAEAASLVGVSASYFDKLVRDGIMPQPLPFPGVKRWDKKKLQRAVASTFDESTDDEAFNPIDRALGL